MYRKYYLLSLILALCVTFVYGKNEAAGKLYQLSGKINDARNHTILPAASMAAIGTSIGVLSNKDGKYTLSIASGSVHLSVRYI
jgi:hypothetical protein